ncbi:MAG: thioredoxin family protein [Bacteroidota bacterium]
MIAGSICSFLLVAADCARAQDLTGVVTPEQITTNQRLFDVYSKRYKPNKKAISQLNEVQDSLQIIVAFGMWCHDSKKHVPALLRVLRELDNPRITTEFRALTRKKEDPKNTKNAFNIIRTPTIMLFRSGSELGRIIETPRESVEEDLVSIIRGDYVPMPLREH